MAGLWQQKELGSSSKPFILIIEDDENLLMTLKRYLELKGFAIDTACSGKEAAAKIATTDYDVAIIDVTLPDIKGTELLPKFRRTIPAVRKIVMTGYVTVDNAIEAVNNGASLFLAKPVKPDNLLAVIKRQLEERELEMQLFLRTVEKFISQRLETICPQ